MEKVLSLLLTILICVYNTNAQTITKNEKEIEEDVIFQQVEIEAEFPGGNREFSKFLQKNLNGNVPTQNNAKKGTYTVIVKFLVDKDGSVSEIVAETNKGFGMENEVKRVLQKSPKWNPARQNGLVVKSVKKLPVSFVVQ